MSNEEIIKNIKWLKEAKFTFNTYKELYTELKLSISLKAFLRRIEKYNELKVVAKSVMTYSMKNNPVNNPVIIGIKSNTEQELYKENLYQRLKEISKQITTIQTAKEYQKIEINPINNKIAIVHISCPHFGASNIVQLMEDTSTIINTPNMYVTVLGDMTDNNIEDWTLKLNYQRKFTQEEELFLAKSWLLDIKEKLLLYVEGNHDERTLDRVGVSFYKEFLKDQKFGCLYDLYEIPLYIKVNNFSTKWIFRHHFNGNTPKNPFNGSKKYICDHIYHDYEYAVSGHIHNGSLINQFNYANKIRTSLLINTYKQIDEYGVSLGMSSVLKEPIIVSLIDSKNNIIVNTTNLNFAKEWLSC